MTEELHFEDWGATYGSPYLIEDDAPGEDAELAEPVEPFTITPEAPELRELAFVDGVRRVEGLVYHRGEDGLLARGVVGAHACGAVVVHPNPGVAYERLRTRRMLVLGSGRRAKLAPTLGYGWEWHGIAWPTSTPDPGPSAPHARGRGAAGRATVQRQNSIRPGRRMDAAPAPPSHPRSCSSAVARGVAAQHGAIDQGARIAWQIERDTGQRRHRAGGAEQAAAAGH